MTDAEALTQAIEGESAPGVDDAADFATGLLGLFQTRDVIDHKTFVAGIRELFLTYPRSVVKRVCSPITGLATKESWLPSIATIKAALEAECEARRDLLGKAEWTIAEHERRRLARESDDIINNSKGSLETRQSRVAEIMAAARLKSMGNQGITA